MSTVVITIDGQQISTDITAEQVKTLIESLTAPNKLSPNAIQGLTVGTGGTRRKITANGALVANRLVDPTNALCDSYLYAYGIATESVANGVETEVIVAGIAMLELSAAVYAGDQIVSDTDGKGQGGSAPVSCVALEDGNIGETILVKLR